MGNKTASPTTKVARASNPNRGAKPGERRGGRAAGTPNKTTAKAKEAIALAFDALGGVDALVTWAQTDDDNRKVFYAQIWTKIIPLQLDGPGESGEHVHKIILAGFSG